MPDTNDALAGWGVNFPKVGLVVNGEKKFYPLRDAVIFWDSGNYEVEDTGEVLEEDFHVRRMTEEESRAFQERADEYSASK